MTRGVEGRYLYSVHNMDLRVMFPSVILHDHLCPKILRVVQQSSNALNVNLLLPKVKS